MPRKIPQLDAVRGVAILMVMLHNYDLFGTGWMGVDLFFVLSGFLITGILLDAKGSAGYFRNFYARRCLRIWPLYFALVAFMFVLVPLLRPAVGQNVVERSAPWWAYPLFLQNFVGPIATQAAGPLGVTWSLAIEEQFYLVWPLVVWSCSPALLGRLALAEICVAPVLRLVLASHGVDLYTNVFCRLDGLMAGALLALAVRADGFVPARLTRRAWAAFLVAAPLAALTEVVLHARWIVFSLTAAASVAFVYLALFAEQRWLRAAMTNRFLVYTGAISYGLYLLHKIPLDAARLLGGDRYPLLALPLAFAAAYLAAALSWRLLEQPFLRLKRFFEPAPGGPGDQRRRWPVWMRA
jgi:peptidoglycan/LPS O-acetylase OafA/YrhL